MLPTALGNPSSRSRYMVSPDGQIWDSKRKKFLPQYLRDGKYMSVCFSSEGDKGKMYIVHRIIASTYIDNPKNLPQVNHIARKNAFKAHLVTRSLSSNDVPKIKSMYAKGTTQREIGVIFGISQSQVSRAINGINYRELSHV